MTHIEMETPRTTLFKFKFDGRPQGLKAATFLSCVGNLIHCLEEINQTLNHTYHTQNRLELRIHGLKKTAEADLELVEYNEGLLPNQPGMDSVLDVLVRLLEVKRFLKANHPKYKEEINSIQTEIVNADGDTRMVSKLVLEIYESNQRINTELSHIFKLLDQDEDITGLILKDENNFKLFYARKKQLKGLSKKLGYLAAEKREVIESVTVSITRISFENHYRWEFYLQGKKVSARILDQQFFDKINQGERFAKGDVLHIDIRRFQVYDAQLDAYIDKAFEVEKVHSHIPREPQLELF